MNELAQRLPAVLRGDDVRLDPDDGLVLAQMCYAQGRHASAVRLWAKVFAADPKRAEDREHQNRYNAACSAALASTGRTKDEPPPDQAARAKHRAQALGWLRAELLAWSQALDAATPQARQLIRQNLEHWKNDTDLAEIRDDAKLALLPEAERAVCKQLWNDVSVLLKQAGADK
jgi:hypothetical protein